MKLKKLLLAGGAAAIVTASTAYASIVDRPFFQVLGVVVVWGADGIDGTDDAPVVSDFVLLTNASGSAGADLISADGATVITGTLDAIKDDEENVDGLTAAANPVTGGATNGTFTDNGTAGVLDAADTLTAFGIDASSDVTGGMLQEHTSSFYVASNAAFDIFASSSAFTATGDFDTDGDLDMSNITFAMALDVAGDDGLAYGGNAQSPGTFPGTVTDLDDMNGVATKVFDGTVRTAAARGSLASQSVRFDNTYTLDDGTGLGYDLSMGSGTVQADVTYTIYVP